jgi:hypothetical protein
MILRNLKDFFLRKDTRLLRGILNKNKIDSGLHQKIIMYMNFIWSMEETEKAEKRLNFVEKLPYPLREEYLNQTSGKALKLCRFFASNFSEAFLNQLAHHVKSRNFAAGELILEVTINFSTFS